MKFDIKELKDGGIELAIGTTATILSLHAVRRMPNKYVGWVLLGAGLIGYMSGHKVVKTASIVIASLGAVKALNMIGLENGTPSSTGIRGMVNKVVPQLNGVEGLGSVERMNENLLGSGLDAEDLLGLGARYDDLEGLGDDLDKLTGVNDDLEGTGDEDNRVEGFGSLM